MKERIFIVLHNPIPQKLTHLAFISFSWPPLCYIDLVMIWWYKEKTKTLTIIEIFP